MRVLVIEDDDWVREGLRRALQLAGYQVMLAVDREEGLLRAQTVVPDAIVLDLGLPVVDGMEACRAARQRRSDPDSDAHRARRMPGSGLGLAIVKQAAEAHGDSPSPPTRWIDSLRSAVCVRHRGQRPLRGFRCFKG